MNTRALELLPDYILGTISEEDALHVEASLAVSPTLQKEADALREAFGLLPASLPMPAPSPDIKKRLMQAVEHQERFAPFVPALSKYWDLTVERVREVLTWIDDSSREWLEGPMPGIRVLDFDGGPLAANADVGIVRLPPDLHFPWHRHHGREINFVLQGEMHDFDGRVYRPGDCIDKSEGSEHEFHTGPGEVLLGVAIIDGIEITEKPQS